MLMDCHVRINSNSKQRGIWRGDLVHTPPVNISVIEFAFDIDLPRDGRLSNRLSGPGVSREYFEVPPPALELFELSRDGCRQRFPYLPRHRQPPCAFRIA